MVIIQTVLGPVDPKVLGRTLTHEHLSLNFEDHFHVPPPIDLEEFLNKKITLENVGFVKQYPYSSRYNLEFFDVETQNAVKKDVELFKKLGGGAIVENTSYGLHRNLEFLYETSKSTGVHVIAGTGHYIQAKQWQTSLDLKMEELTDLYNKEIITGCELIGGEIVKCGFIGEVGSCWPIHDFEKRAIMATGEIQEVLGCGVSFHPGLNTKAPFEIIRLYLEAGGKAEKCVISHLDLIPFDIDELLEFSKLGTYLQYDLFGMESSYFQFDPELDMLSDAQRINNLLKLIAEGKEDKILMSHDIHTKHRLTSFGGHGYSHIQTNIIPRLYSKGLSLDQVYKITVQNPANWLSFSA